MTESKRFIKPIVEFNQEAVKAYLDKCILFWIKEKNKHIEVDSKSLYYIDAYQSMRVSLFGEMFDWLNEGKEE